MLFRSARDSSGRNSSTADAVDGPLVGNFSDGEYRFIISRQIQRIISGQLSNNGIYLVASGSVGNAERTLLMGPADIKLNLTYTLQKK